LSQFALTPLATGSRLRLVTLGSSNYESSQRSPKYQHFERGRICEGCGSVRRLDLGKHVPSIFMPLHRCTSRGVSVSTFRSFPRQGPALLVPKFVPMFQFQNRGNCVATIMVDFTKTFIAAWTTRNFTGEKFLTPLAPRTSAEEVRRTDDEL
jgi:hypothetical protein